jgi:lysosomal acid lipase/cholesteryl ester hydrolase
MTKENVSIPMATYLGLIYGLTILAFEALLRLGLYIVPSFIFTFLDLIRTQIFGFYPKIRLVRKKETITNMKGKEQRKPPSSPLLLRRTSMALPEQFQISDVSEIEGDRIQEHPRVTMNVTQLVQDSGYPIEEHVVKTEDGYMLVLHRIPRGKTSSYQSNIKETHHMDSNEQQTLGTPRPVVFIMHGFLQDSEVWVCNLDSSGSLAFSLVDAGYDVWLGNNRGNKYSHKHIYYKPTEDRFWDYSLDELALFDVPACIEFITDLTKVNKLTYIGFSQGSAQAFACFSLNQKIADKVNLFVALAPSTRVNGLEYKISDSISRLSPLLLFPIFGRQKFLTATVFWQRFLSNKMFALLIDFFLDLLFGWKSQNIREEDKQNFYAHLYSYGSVKIVIHWFQIIRRGRFEMFDDTEDSLGKSHRPQIYPLSQIQTPIALFYGGSDKLPNIDYLLSELRTIVWSKRIDKYEHLDFMWAHDVRICVYEDILRLIKMIHAKS